MFDTESLDTFIGSLRREVVAALPDARIEEGFAELRRAWEQLDAERLRRLAEIERRRLSNVPDICPRRRGSPRVIGWGGERRATTCGSPVSSA
jgi:hypothetical protein